MLIESGFVMRKIVHLINALVFSFFITNVVFATEVKVAVGLALPPYVIEESNNGIEVDILRQSLLYSGNTIKLFYLPFARVPWSMRMGHTEAALTINESSALKDVCYSDSHISYQNVAVSLKSRNIKADSLEDLSSLSIVAFQNATKYLGPDFAAMAKGNEQYVELAHQESQVKMLFSGRADVVVMDINIFKYFRKQVQGMGENVGAEITLHEIFPPTPYRVAFKSKALCEAFNEGLKKLKSEGKYNSIVEKYIK